MKLVLPRDFSLRTIRLYTLVALLFQWIILLSGATVRITGSGLGCPTWPTCSSERAIPELEFHAIVEFTNRMIATPTLLTALLALYIVWRSSFINQKLVRITTTLVVIGVLIQAGVGALTVIWELPPVIVSIHFGISILLIVLATVAWRLTTFEQPAQFSTSLFSIVSTATVLLCLLIVTVAGVVTTASGPHSGAAGSDVLVERLNHFNFAVTVHARAAYVYAAGAILLFFLKRTKQGKALRWLIISACLVAIQIVLGEIQLRNALPWQIVFPHVANAALIWISTTIYLIEVNQRETLKER